MKYFVCIGFSLFYAGVVLSSDSQDPQPAKHLMALNRSLKAKVLQPGREIPVEFLLGPGWKVNAAAPSQFLLFQRDGLQREKYRVLNQFSSKDILGKGLRLPALKASMEYRFQGTLYFCKSNAAAVCSMESFDIQIYVETSKKSGESSGNFVIPLDRGYQ